MLKGKSQAVHTMVRLLAREMSVPLQTYSGITIFVHCSGITIFVQMDSHRFYQSTGKNLLQ